MSSIKYQAHIDGMRALAVLAVVIFHIHERYMPGGFLGVDVFFVISGYLITGIIYKQKLNDSFSFAEFYKRRAKRILPPLFFMLFIVLAAGYWLLLPYEYYKLAISSASVVLFVANMQYAMRTGDYFSNDSAEWPLLHTWSLSVEEQYYFLFPLLLFVCLLKCRKHKLLILSIIALSSFCLAEWFSRTEELKGYSYYFVGTRMGELLVGSLLALCQAQNVIKRTRSSFVTGIAFASLLIMLFLVNERTVFPGFIALLLCLLAAIIINSDNRVTKLFFENRIMINFGLLSYSLYLFHWPVLAYTRYLFNVDGSVELETHVQILCALCMVSISIFSYHFVEKPLRNINISPRSTAVLYFLSPTLIILTLSSFIFLKDGVPSRLDTEHVKAKMQFTHIDRDKCPGLSHIGCLAGAVDSKKSVILFGNSHAQHYFEFVSSVAESMNYRAELYAKGGCEVGSNDLTCSRIREAFFQAIKTDKPDVVVIAFRWDLDVKNTRFLIALERLLKEVKEQATRVILLAQPPLLEQNPAKVINCNRLGLDCGNSLSFSALYPSYNNVIRDIATSNNVDFFDPFIFVEDATKFKDGEKVFYFDKDHLSIYGNMWLANAYIKQKPTIFLK